MFLGFDTLALLHAVFESANELASIWVSECALSCLLASCELPDVHFPVWPDFLPLAVGLPCLPLTCVLSAVFLYRDSVTLDNVIDETTGIGLSTWPCHLRLFVIHLVLFPLSLISLAGAPDLHTIAASLSELIS